MGILATIRHLDKLQYKCLKLVSLYIAKIILNIMDADINRVTNIQSNKLNEVIKLFKCELCLKSFTRNTNFDQYVKHIHKKQKELSCTLCLKAFGTNKELIIHFQTVHAKEKRFTCDVCSKSFV